MYDALAWVATGLAFSGYVGVTLALLNNTSRYFLYANFIASFLFILHGFSIDSYSAVVQNLFFGSFAFLGIVKCYISFSWFNIKLLLILIALSFLVPVYFYPFLSSEWFFETLGWPSVCSIVGAFILYTQKKITTKAYFILNVIGNVFLSIHLIHFGNYQFAALQIFALFMGIFGVYRLLKEQKKVS